MNWFIVMIVALVVSLPSYTFAEQEHNPQQHSKEIFRLTQVLVAKDFESMTVVAKGASKEEALVKAVLDICARIGLRSISPTLCKCLKNINYIPKEQSSLLLKVSRIVSETESRGEGVTLVLKLDSEQLKQMAYFEMWPLFERRFRTESSS